MITIQSDLFTASISPAGAELQSLKNRITAEEFIWQADPTVWGGAAPLLFPIVGRLKDGKTVINGKAYKIPKHGFARNSEFTVIDQKTDRITLELTDSERTLAFYPFNFALRCTFTLTNEGLSASYSVENRGEDEMLFTIGFHPGFALDLEKAPLSDYFIEFNQPETLDLYGLTNGLLEKKSEHYLENQTRIQLSENTFADDALIFQNIQSRSVRLNRQNSDWSIKMDIRNAPHIGFWAKPGAPYVCLEPWFSFDDPVDSDGQFKNKPGILKLTAGTSFKTGYTLSV